MTTVTEPYLKNIENILLGEGLTIKEAKPFLKNMKEIVRQCRRWGMEVTKEERKIIGTYRKNLIEALRLREKSSVLQDLTPDGQFMDLLHKEIEKTGWVSEGFKPPRNLQRLVVNAVIFRWDKLVKKMKKADPESPLAFPLSAVTSKRFSEITASRFSEFEGIPDDEEISESYSEWRKRNLSQKKTESPLSTKATPYRICALLLQEINGEDPGDFSAVYEPRVKKHKSFRPDFPSES